MDKKALGNKIEYYRSKHGMTQTEFAEKIGVSGKTIVSKLENGAFFPSIETLLKISEVLEVSIDDLTVDYLGVPANNLSDSAYYQDIRALMPIVDDDVLIEFKKIINEYKKTQ